MFCQLSTLVSLLPSDSEPQSWAIENGNREKDTVTTLMKTIKTVKTKDLLQLHL